MVSDDPASQIDYDVGAEHVILASEIRRLRRLAGMTQAALAAESAYSREYVSRAERPQAGFPSFNLIRLIDRALKADGDLIKLYELADAQRHARRRALCAEPGLTADAPVPVPVASSRGESRGRADVAAGSTQPGLTSFVQPAGLKDAICAAAHQTAEHAMDAGAVAVSDTTLEQLRDDVARIARDYAQAPPAAALNETLRVRNIAFGLLERTRRPAQINDLYLVAAQAAALLSSESFDLGMWDAAMEFARAAHTYGEVIDHNGVRAYARSLQAMICYWNGQPCRAVDYARAAVEIAPDGNASVRAHSIAARAWSHCGDIDQVTAAIAAADDAATIEGIDDLADVVGGEFGFDDAQRHRSHGTAWLQVGRVDNATEATRVALELYAARPGSQWPTVAAEASVDLGAAQVLANRLDAAADALQPVWDMPVEWRRNGLVARLDRVRGLVSQPQWRTTPAAIAISERVEAFAITTAQRPRYALPLN